MATADHETIDRLVIKARERDRAAFSQLTRLMMNDIVALTYKMTGNRDTAMDLTQDTFIAAWENLPGFRGEARFENWLYRIAANKTLNYLSAASTSRTSSFEVDPNEEQALKAATPTPDVQLERKQLKADIFAFMQQLPVQQRLVFELRFYKQLPFEEIALLTNRALGTVKTHYREAVAKLREYAKHRGWHS